MKRDEITSCAQEKMGGKKKGWKKKANVECTRFKNIKDEIGDSRNQEGPSNDCVRGKKRPLEAIIHHISNK